MYDWYNRVLKKSVAYPYFPPNGPLSTYSPLAPYCEVNMLVTKIATTSSILLEMT